MNNIYILVGENKEKIDTLEIENVEIKYSFKDIKNYGKRNTSFTKPINILFTKNTNRIFKSLFNINNVNGYNVNQLQPAEILEDGIVILKGSLQITNILEDHYEAVVFTNTLNLFNIIGDKLIVGNLNTDDDLSFPAGLYAHDWNRTKIRESLSESHLPADGSGYLYPIVDYTNNITKYSENLITNPLKANYFNDDYLVFPSVFVKEIFDKIFSENSFSYEILDSSISTAFKNLIIPYNNDFNLLKEDYKYARYYIGNPEFVSGSSPALIGYTTSQETYSSGRVIPAGAAKGWCFKSTYVGSTYDVSLGHDDILNTSYPNQSGSYDIGAADFLLPHAGTYTIDVSLYYSVSSSIVVKSDRFLTFWNRNQGNFEIKLTGGPASDAFTDPNIGTVSISNFSINVTVTEKTIFSIYKSSLEPGVQLLFHDKTHIEITELSSLLKPGIEFEMNTMLPQQYKQSDLINDIFKIFNFFISVNENDSKKLILDSYKSFYNDEIVDWTNKIDDKSIKFSSLKTLIPRVNKFNFGTDSDVYLNDYSQKRNYSYHGNEILNNSEFADGENSIQLYTSPIVSINVPDSSLLLKTIITDEINFKTNWKPRIGFISESIISAMRWGSDSSDNTRTIEYWTTLSPRFNNIDVSDNIFLGFSNIDSYLTNGTENNQTLYNLYYKEELERNLSDNSYFLEAKFKLNGKDIFDVKNFRKKILIRSKIIGDAYYRLNEIKNYTPNNDLTDVELIKIENYNNSYDNIISTNVLTKSVNVAGTTTGGSSGSSSESSGSGVVTSYQNAVENKVITSTGEGGIKGETNLEFDGSTLTLNGDEIIYENLIIYKEVSIGSSLYVSKDVSINNNLKVTNTIQTNKLNVLGDSSISSLYVSKDVSINNNLKVTNTIQTNKLNVLGDSSISSLYVSKDVSVGNKLTSNKLLINQDSSIKSLFSNDVSIRNNTYIGGRLGIGITSPTVKLDVDGSIQAKGLTIISPAGGDGGWKDGIIIKNTGAGGEAALVFNNSLTDPSNWFVGLNQAADFRINYGSSFTNDYQKLLINTSGDVSLYGGLNVTNNLTAPIVKIPFGGIIGCYAGTTPDCYLQITDDNPAVHGITYGAEFKFFGDELATASLIYTGGMVVHKDVSIAGTVYTNNITLYDDLGSPTFASGFVGSGWKIDNTSGKITATFDNLVVREEMKVYELVIDKIRAQKGSVLISAGAAKVSTAVYNSGVSWTVTFDDDDGEISNPFVVGDILRCQNFTGRDIKLYFGQVTTSSGESITFNKTSGSGDPSVGDEIVQWGHVSNAARQNIIYVTASDDNNPYIDILAGIDSSGITLTKTKVRLGNLAGITDPLFPGMTGYGLYTSNAYLKNAYLSGTIYANDGSIGGWEIDASKLSSGIGAANRIELNKADNQIKIYATTTLKTVLGNLATVSDPLFPSMTGYGLWSDNAYLKNAKVSGTIWANDGSIGGWEIDSSKLSSKAGGVSRIELNTTDNRINIYENTTLKAAFGNLANISDPLFPGMTGYSLYANNAYLNNATIKGTIYANDGSIGGWFVGTNYLQSGKTGTQRIQLDNVDQQIKFLNTANAELLVMGAGTVGSDWQMNLETATNVDLLIANGGNGLLRIDSYGVIPDDLGVIYVCSQNSGGATQHGQVAFGSDNNYSTPVITFASDTNTGIFRRSDGIIGISSNGTDSFRFDVSTFHARGNVVANSGVFSDKRLKTNIVPLTNSLNKVLELKGIEYDDIDGNGHHLGFIAQEVEKLIPEVVFETTPIGKNKKYKAIRYTELIPYITESVKELSSEINKLKKENIELKDEIRKIKYKINYYK